MAIELEKQAESLATIDKAVEVILGVGIGTKENISDLIRAEREKYKIVIIDDITAAHWLITKEATFDPAIKERFLNRFQVPLSHGAIWDAFGGRKIDRGHANLPIDF